jgi:hypothetical protein
MNIGLPGTGIGALFYVLLVLAMPVRELWVRRARPHLRRSWGFIARQIGMALGMLSVFWVEMHLITSSLQRAGLRPATTTVAGGPAHAGIGSYLSDQASRSAIASLTMMFALLAVIHAVAWVGVLRARSRA